MNEESEEAGPLQKAYSRLTYPDENERPSFNAHASPLLSGHLLQVIATSSCQTASNAASHLLLVLLL